QKPRNERGGQQDEHHEILELVEKHDEGRDLFPFAQPVGSHRLQPSLGFPPVQADGGIHFKVGRHPVGFPLHPATFLRHIDASSAPHRVRIPCPMAFPHPLHLPPISL